MISKIYKVGEMEMTKTDIRQLTQRILSYHFCFKVQNFYFQMHRLIPSYV